MTRKPIKERELARLASAKNEAECINTTIAKGGMAICRWAEGYCRGIESATESDGVLWLVLFDKSEAYACPPSSILPGGRGVWEQIELMEAPKK